MCVWKTVFVRVIQKRVLSCKQRSIVFVKNSIFFFYESLAVDFFKPPWDIFGENCACIQSRHIAGNDEKNPW